MRKTLLIIAGMAAAFALGFVIKGQCSNSCIGERDLACGVKDEVKKDTIKTTSTMKLGAFSVSLSVKDLQVSKEFYEKLGFTQFGGGMEMNYLIMKNESTLIGLFQGMFQGNILTFNPGWDHNAQNIEDFQDVRAIQKHLLQSGITIDPKADETTTGPASFMLTDPDGNVILFDQHR